MTNHPAIDKPTIQKGKIEIDCRIFCSLKKRIFQYFILDVFEILEQNNYRIDESLQAKLLFGGRLAVKYMGQYQLEYQCNPPLEKPINICQTLNQGLTRADLISNITLPEPNNLNQHQYLANVFKNQIPFYDYPNNSMFYWLGFFTESDCESLKDRQYFFISEPEKQPSLNFANLWLPNEPNECAESGLVSNYDGKVADMETNRIFPIWCMYVEETSIDSDYCSPVESLDDFETNPDDVF